MNQRINASFLHIRNLKQRRVAIMTKGAQVFGKLTVVKKNFLSARIQLQNLVHIVFTKKVTKRDTGRKMNRFVYLLWSIIVIISKVSDNASDYECRIGGMWKDVTAQLEADYCSSKTRYFQHYVATLLMLTILYYI